jgi:hypothetical protein
MRSRLKVRQMFRRGETRLHVAIAVAVIALAIAVVRAPMVDALLHREQYQAEVRALHDSVQPGMTKEQVQRLLDPSRYPHLQIRRTDAHLWSAAAPLELGATNWVLYIEFENGCVSTLGIRTGDGRDDHPDGAPHDKPTR